MTALLDNLLDEGGAALLQQLRGEHHCPACSGSDPDFHDECGYAWTAHDNKVRGNRLPFGCPSETTAREAWGR